MSFADEYVRQVALLVNIFPISCRGDEFQKDLLFQRRSDNKD